MHPSHMEEYSKNAMLIVLDGDRVDPIPPHLESVLGLGTKYVPYPLVASFRSKNLGPIVNEFIDLRRRPYWSTFFHLIMLDGEVPPQSTQITNLKTKSGMFPPHKVLERLGGKYHTINNWIERYKDIALLHLSEEHGQGQSHQGTRLAFHLFADFLSDHIVLRGDKDGSATVMFVQCYKREIEIDTDSVLNGSKVYQEIGDANVNEKWETNALSWHRTLQELVVGYPPILQIAKVRKEALPPIIQITRENTQVHVPKEPRGFCFETSGWPHALQHHRYLIRSCRERQHFLEARSPTGSNGNTAL